MPACLPRLRQGAAPQEECKEAVHRTGKRDRRKKNETLAFRPLPSTPTTETLRKYSCICGWRVAKLAHQE